MEHNIFLDGNILEEALKGEGIRATPWKILSSLLLMPLVLIKSKNPLKLQRSIPKRGDLLLAMGSPFGILSPLHFFNNSSVGSVGNNYPPSSSTRSLLMADIRCLPGMEGSPVFGEQAQFIGLLARPLRQKISGTEVQMVIPWEAIASACSELLLEKRHSTWNGVNYSNQHLSAVETILPKGYSYGLPNHSQEQIRFGSRLLSPVEKAMSSICLITTDDGSWASGVLLNKQGLVLTNAHLLEPWRFGKQLPPVTEREEIGGFYYSKCSYEA